MVSEEFQLYEAFRSKIIYELRRCSKFFGDGTVVNLEYELCWRRYLSDEEMAVNVKSLLACDA